MHRLKVIRLVIHYQPSHDSLTIHMSMKTQWDWDRDQTVTGQSLQGDEEILQSFS